MKTAELKGAALDWAVAKSMGWTLYKDVLLNGASMRGWWISGIAKDPNKWMSLENYRPSVNWAQGGPIIDRHPIQVGKAHDRDGSAAYSQNGVNCVQYGPTPLIAAMRCYVASKFGDEVEIPEVGA